MKIQLPKKFRPLFKPKRFKVFYGGRGGAKTVSFSKALLAIAAQEKKQVLCLREFQNSIDDSVHSSLCYEVDQLGLNDFYKIETTKIIGENGSLFRYAGLARNIASIKSKDHFDIAWIEEGETITQKSLDVLIPTLRRTGSELWVSFNPDREDAPIYKEFILPYIDEINKAGYYEDDRIIVVKTLLTDNPFAPRELIKDSQELFLKNPAKWKHIYGGECGGNYDDPIFEPEWWQYYDILPSDYEYKAIFCDTALKDKEGNDFTVFQCWAKRKGRIYLVDQYRAKIKATDLEQAFIEFWNKHKGSPPQICRLAYIEDKASGIQLIQDIQKKGGIPVEAIPRSQSKLERAKSLSPWIKSGLLCLPSGASWVYDYKKEFERFSDETVGKSGFHDDQIDPTLDAIEKMLITGVEYKKTEQSKAHRPLAPTMTSTSW